MKTHPITDIVIAKGHVAKDVAARWDMSPRTFSRRAANPDQLFVDAVNGLPSSAGDVEPLCSRVREWELTTGLPLGEEPTVLIKHHQTELNRADLVAMLGALN